MQKPLLWFTLLLIVMLATPLHAEQLTGKWRGKLQMTPQAALTIGINISNATEGYSLTIDSPNQTMFDYVPSQFKIEGNSVQFQDDKLNASFNGTLQQGQLRGEFSQGKTIPLNLQKLDDTQLKLLENEGSWFGDLVINNSARLPLVLNIAVADQGYHVTLDSPKQQSFGIPVDKFNLTDNTMEFNSAIINASYSATWQDDSWQGTFVQGSAMPLVLKKKPD
ncbi:hypothetical protein [Arsukibacterium tuosuense]|uniref:hypothetical protein n=1 Tax=Arsukibacterium tuosuense TaxID=1323745 RepID=UPI000BE25DAE|nr:hypothetical protein [Arsukibacterium tuosuense]